MEHLPIIDTRYESAILSRDYSKLSPKMIEYDGCGYPLTIVDGVTSKDIKSGASDKVTSNKLYGLEEPETDLDDMRLPVALMAEVMISKQGIVYKCGGVSKGGEHSDTPSYFLKPRGTVLAEIKIHIDFEKLCEDAIEIVYEADDELYMNYFRGDESVQHLYDLLTGPGHALVTAVVNEFILVNE